jgi:hypothetical protein
MLRNVDTFYVLKAGDEVVALSTIVSKAGNVLREGETAIVESVYCQDGIPLTVDLRWERGPVPCKPNWGTLCDVPVTAIKRKPHFEHGNEPSIIRKPNL